MPSGDSRPRTTTRTTRVLAPLKRARSRTHARCSPSPTSWRAPSRSLRDKLRAAPMSALEQLLQQLADPSGIAWNEETYDLALANTLVGQERAEYVAKLIENAGQGDTHAILTLGHMQVEEA